MLTAENLLLVTNTAGPRIGGSGVGCFPFPPTDASTRHTSLLIAIPHPGFGAEKKYFLLFY